MTHSATANFADASDNQMQEGVTGSLPPEAQWSPQMIGRALRMVHVLANTPHTEWRSKSDLHQALAEFRDSERGPLHDVSTATKGA